jgi:energy-converting hydrogenase Eha subunit B
MSDELEFAILARSLGNGDFARRVLLTNRLRRCVSLIAAGLGLLVLAVLLTLTNTMSIVVTLAVVSMVLSEVVRLGVSEHRRAAA